MGWFANLLRGKKTARLEAEVRRLRGAVNLALRARYDASITHEENKNLWTLTDLLSAKAANSYSVRQTLRTRSRYEVANNSYARGITLTLANDLIGTGPRLQVLLGDRGVNTQIEAAFHAWMRAVCLSEKLRTMKLAKVGDGEAFALFVTNPQIEDPVQLDLSVIEADQVTTPNLGFDPRQWVDGVILDQLGNIQAYHVLKTHPGDSMLPLQGLLEYDTLPTRHVLHWFRRDRPGQVRGIPEITPALELFGKLRRFTNSVLAAAETAANFAALIKSTAPPDDSSNADDSTGTSTGTAAEGNFPTFELQRAMMTFLPDGWEGMQLKPEQPAANMEMFVRLLLREIARCLNVPFNVAAGDSSGYNYSSGRLDHLSYHRMQAVERSHCEAAVLDRIFTAWLDEAVMIPGLLPEGVAISCVPHEWFWDPAESIDPVKDATATQIEMANGTTTLKNELAKQGSRVDWEEHVAQLGREAAAKKAAGLTLAAGLPQSGAAKVDRTQNGMDAEKHEQEMEEAAAAA